ncbi:MAG: hypothetical protein OXJ90_28540, partial [Spirochaetaceae bacterium]|nr:hypothetical protein [Spirochaetaceae bacterium]
MDGPPDPLGRGLDLPVSDMSVAHGHPHIAVPEQARDDRQGNAVHRRLAGYRVTQVVQAHVFD